MAEREIRTQYEGELRWVQASGSGVGWVTASAAAGTLIGYVQAGLSTNKVQNFNTISDRGYPKHHKFGGTPAPEVSFTVLFGITANYPTQITASGMSVPAIHLELKMRMDEYATGSGLYYQWMNCVPLSRQFGEAEAGNTLAFSYRALQVNEFTGSGYLA
jgi:hypothetical protein